MNNDLPIMLTVNQTAEAFGISRHFARQLALTGQVNAVRSGKKILINRSSVARYFESATLKSESSSIGIRRVLL